jgi:Sphingosine kinase and enzymes related to eukaryotic diacylglycerol kinase
MHRLHVINPAAGKRSPVELVSEKLTGEEYYITTGIGDAERFIRERCADQPDTHVFVYGGDGTLNEIVNGILAAGAGEITHISVVPTGTGNDFNRLLEHGFIKHMDVMRYRALIGDTEVDRYAINIINTGFDSTAVAKTQNYKKLPFVTGSAAYIMGVTDTLMRRMGEQWKLSFTNPDDTVTEEEGEYLLALVANGRYYGGGFKAAPIAEIDDGMLDVLTSRRLSRPAFIGLVAEYRKGGHIDPETQKPIKKFAKILDYKRCVKISLEGLKTVCVDGEVMPCTNIGVEVVPKAVTIVS